MSLEEGQKLQTVYILKMQGHGEKVSLFWWWFLNVLLMRTAWQQGYFDHTVTFLSENYTIDIKACKLVFHEISVIISVPQDLVILSELGFSLL